MLKLLVAVGFFDNPENLESWERDSEYICVMTQEYSKEAESASDAVFLDGVLDEAEKEFIPVYKYCIIDNSQPPSEIAKK